MCKKTAHKVPTLKELQKKIKLLELEKANCDLQLDKCLDSMVALVDRLEALELKVTNILEEQKHE